MEKSIKHFSLHCSLFLRNSSCWQHQITFVIYFLLLLNHVHADTPHSHEINHVNYTTFFSKERLTEKTSNVEQKCLTRDCIKVATNMKSYFDESVDPCENFYQFACGNYIKNTQIPEGKGTIDLFSSVDGLVGKQLRTIINEPIQSNESRPLRLAKYFYESCLNEEMIEKRGVKPLADILDELGGWPIVKGDSWTDVGWDWIQIIKKFRRIGLNTRVIFSLGIETDMKNSTRRVLLIDQTQHDFEREFLMNGLSYKAVKSYYNSMVESAVIFNANRKQAKNEMKEALKFEIKLAKISLSREERRNDTALYHLYTIKQLQESYPYLNWLDYINAFLPTGLDVHENETIINFVPTFFDQLEVVLNSTSKRTIANYLLWRAVLTTYGTLTHDLRKLHSRSKIEPRWTECIQLTSEKFAIPMGVSYIHKFFNEKSKQTAIDLVKDIRNTFIDILHKVPWMDERTREKAIEKAQALRTHIGYQSELENWLLALEEEYKDLEMEPDNFLLNTLRLEIFDTDYLLHLLHEPVNKDDSDILLNPADVNAHYVFTENAILIPAAIFQDRFYSIDRPNFVNYASIGSLIGHEITHGFDDQGRQYDFDGNLADWWDADTEKQFLEKANCIIEQYGNYTDLQTNLTLNGIATQGENIADNGGVKQAYYAYKKWHQRSGPEGLLPGLKYNQQQLFWISYAQIWCSKSRDYVVKSQIIADSHAPNEFRINGAISNMPDYTFAHDFNCPVGTRMNPTKKCSIW